MKKIYKNGNVYHRELGTSGYTTVHREDAPAVIHANGDTGWRRMGKTYRRACGSTSILPNGQFRPFWRRDGGS
jgi:hypothetical protein